MRLQWSRVKIFFHLPFSTNGLSWVIKGVFPTWMFMVSKCLIDADPTTGTSTYLRNGGSPSYQQLFFTLIWKDLLNMYFLTVYFPSIFPFVLLLGCKGCSSLEDLLGSEISITRTLWFSILGKYYWSEKTFAGNVVSEFSSSRNFRIQLKWLWCSLVFEIGGFTAQRCHHCYLIPYFFERYY